MGALFMCVGVPKIFWQLALVMRNGDGNENGIWQLRYKKMQRKNRGYSFAFYSSLNFLI